ncbi:MAG: response regulator transcription factor [Chloroflexi bacterium]|nr:response regulator transcription factor [Chloroflexota bacterium]
MATIGKGAQVFGAAADGANGTPPRVLVVEDDFRIAVFVQRALAQAGYRVELAADGLSALAAAEAAPPDVVVLDVMLPGLDGLEVARRLRAGGGVPILMLTARDAVGDRVQGLDAGADDYLVKPFALEELLARLRALLRRREVDAAERRRGVLAFADLWLDQDTRQAMRGGRRLELRHKEFELLAHFLRHPGRALSRQELFEAVWGYDFLGDSNVIEVTMGQLRQKLEAGGAPRLIHTVRSVGYILREEGAAR